MPPGTAYEIDHAALDLSMAAPQFNMEPECDYDRNLVPDGEEPKMLLSYNVDVSRSFRRETNNWLIRTFGTKPKRFKFSFPMTIGLRSPAFFDLGVTAS